MVIAGGGGRIFGDKGVTEKGGGIASDAKRGRRRT